MNHDFVCVGFPKCATTTLDAILRQHPEIALPCHKETLFFERNDLYDKGLEWYEKRYFGKNLKKYENKIIGEVNPRNVGNGNSEKNIMKVFGTSVKLIYLLRNPVQAVFSMYKHSLVDADIYEDIKKNMWTEGCFDSYVEDYLNNLERRVYGQRSLFALFLYGRYLATALKYVPRQNIYVILFEDFIADPEKETKKLLKFIGASTDIPLNYHMTENVGNRVPKSYRTLKAAKSKFAFWHHFYVPKVPYLGNTVERIWDRWYWTITDKASIHTDLGITMNKETLEKLKNFYRPDVELLDATLHTDFGKRWNI